MGESIFEKELKKSFCKMCQQAFPTEPCVYGAPVQRWIPVTERLPEMHTKVLVYRPKMAKKIMVSYFGYECFCEGATDIHGNEVITHWMPLPEPPKEDAE